MLIFVAPILVILGGFQILSLEHRVGKDKMVLE